MFKGYNMDEIIRSGADGKQIEKITNRVQSSVEKLIQNGYTTFMSDLGMGFGMMAANAVLRAKLGKSNIRLVVVLPFPDWQQRFAPLDRERYTELCAAADERVFTCEQYTPEAHFVRDNFLVDNCSTIVTYYHNTAGEAKYTLDRAASRELTIINLY